VRTRLAYHKRKYNEQRAEERWASSASEGQKRAGVNTSSRNDDAYFAKAA
jgi:hypothetical protein